MTYDHDDLDPHHTEPAALRLAHDILLHTSAIKTRAEDLTPGDETIADLMRLISAFSFGQQLFAAALDDLLTAVEQLVLG